MSPQYDPQTELHAHQLECIRQDRTLFSGLDFTVAGGEILQVEGANGSGKTSLLRVLCGLLLPDAGEIRWRGAAIDDNRTEFLAELTYVGHMPGIKQELTPLENLRMDTLLNKPRDGADLQRALHQLGLYGFEDLPARTLSAGQKRRVALARLLTTEAQLWILDEPFTALDKTGQAFMQETLEQHSKCGGITVLTTHQPITINHCTVRSVQLGA